MFLSPRLQNLLAAPDFRSNLLLGTLCYLLRAVCSLCLPVCVYFFIQWVQEVERLHSLSETAPVPLADGLISACALALCSVLSFYLEAAYMLRVAAAGLAARASMASSIFAAVLSRRLGAAPALNSGEVHNLHSVDTAALEHAPDALLTLLLQPLEILGIVALLVVFTGWAAAGGAMAMVLFNLALTVAAGLAARALDGDRTSAADKRVRALSEFLTGMRAVKLLGWESRFAAAIASARRAESALYGKATPYTGLVNVASSNGIDLISVGLLLVYVLALRLPLSASMVFTYWVLLAALHGRIFHFPIALSEAREAATAWTRLCAFLDAADSAGKTAEAAGRAATLLPPLQGAQATWGGSAAPTLGDITLTIEPGACLAVVGPVAAGKTSLLLALLGELPLALGGGHAAPFTCRLAEVAYVPQSPWTLPTTVRDNILLGRVYEPLWYAQVIGACCLEEDFEAWPQGDLSHTSSTILSGGQRARVALARAAYGRPSFFLADDALSSLDAAVARRVWRELVCGEGALLAGCTRILVTTSAALASDADAIVTVTPSSAGAIVRLCGRGAAALPGAQGAVEAALASPQAHAALVVKEEGGVAGAAGRGQPSAPEPAAALMGRLESLVGGVGGPLFFALVLTCLLSEATFVELSAVVLTQWSDDPGGRLSSIEYYFSAYLVCVALEFVSAYVRQLFYGSGTRRAADAAHAAALGRLEHARMSFFDATSAGSILSAFGRDLSDLDKSVWYSSEYFLLGVAYTAVVIFTNLAFTPYSLVALLPPGLAWYYYCRAGSGMARGAAAASSPAPPPDAHQLHVREPVAPEKPAPGAAAAGAAAASSAEDGRVPITDHLARCLEGGPVLRAFPHATERATEVHAALWRAYAAQQTRACVTETLQVRFFNLLGALYYAATVAIIIPCVLFRASFNTLGGSSSSGLVFMSPGVAGLLLLNAAFASYMLQMMLQNGQALERLREARSRLCSYGVPGGRVACEVEPGGGAAGTAAPAAPPQAAVPPGWPSAGHLTLQGLRLRYAPQLPLVLRGASLELRAGEKVCVVGRTGAGKSSLVAALSRLVECEGDSAMALDGVDLRALPLAAVRRAVCVVTQDALFFEGTLRSNLDPFGEFAEGELEGALRAVGFVGAEALELRSAVGERGAGLSAGQCQLVSLARALLRAPRLLVLDEATASLDVASEERILRALTSGAFAGCSCLIIAHRLSCAVEADRVCVMEGGRVVEAGAPGELLRAGGAFAALVAAAPPAQQAELAARAQRAGKSLL